MVDGKPWTALGSVNPGAGGTVSVSGGVGVGRRHCKSGPRGEWRRAVGAPILHQSYKLTIIKQKMAQKIRPVAGGKKTMGRNFRGEALRGSQWLGEGDEDLEKRWNPRGGEYLDSAQFSEFITLCGYKDLGSHGVRLSGAQCKATTHRGMRNSECGMRGRAATVVVRHGRCHRGKQPRLPGRTEREFEGRNIEFSL